MNTQKRNLYSFFFRCWWTVLLILFCYGLYLHAMHKKKVLYGELKQKTAHLEEKLLAAVSTREDLLMQMQSISDPAWIEMLIKKHLGMVPYGQTKVYFETE